MRKTIQLDVTNELCGFYKLEKFKVDANGNEIPGTRVLAADWFPNLITDFGLEFMGANGNYLVSCSVGSGATPPAVGDTGLNSTIATTNARSAYQQGCQPSSPYFLWARITYRFAQGVAAGNISEIGIRSNVNVSLFSRALILDSNGNPTTITVASDEVLDASYELRVYPFLDDKTGTVVFTGPKGQTHSYVLRAAAVTVNSGAAGWYMGSTVQGIRQNEGRSIWAYTGGLGSITQSPSGTSFGQRTLTDMAYEANSKRGRALVDVPIGTWTGTLRSFSFSIGSGYYQVELNPPIVKEAGDVIQIVFYHSWARRT